MKVHVWFAAGLLLCVYPGTSSADEAWLLVSRNARHALFHATSSGIERVEPLGDLTIYTDTPDKIALLTRDKAAARGKLVIVDKTTKKVASNCPVYEYPASQLSGPSDDLVLIGNIAYFASVRYAVDGRSITPNSLGGTFDFTSVDSFSCRIESLGLPKDAHNPRVVAENGHVIIHAGYRGLAWTFQPGSKEVEEWSSPPEFTANVLNREVDAKIQLNNEHAASATLGGVLQLPDSSTVYIDSESGAVMKVSKGGGAPRKMWDLVASIPGLSPSVTRVIDFTE